MRTMKTGLVAVMAMGMAATTLAQMPEIKGAEQLIRQSPPDILSAKKSIDKAGTIGSAESLAYYWFVRGKVYNYYAEKTSEEYTKGDPDAALKAVQSLYQYYKKAETDAKAKRKYKYDADAVLPAAAVSAFNKGITHSADSNYNKALEVNDALASLVKHDEDHDQILKTNAPGVTYNTVLKNSYITAYQQGDNPKTRKYLNDLINNKYTDPKLHIYIARTYESEGNKKEQLAAIKKGRAAYPESKDIITEEINYYIKNNDLITLKKAINKEIASGNADANYYFIRGYINDQIGNGQFDSSGKKGSGERDTTFMRRAEKDYRKALEMNPSSLDAIYNLGTLYTNFGNYFNKVASNLPYSATKQYDAMKKEEKKYFDMAISYYEQADGFSELSKEERIRMYTDMKQLYGKAKNVEKIREMNSKIKALNNQQ